MENAGKNNQVTRQIRGTAVFLAGLSLSAMFYLAGCGDFFAIKPTELESVSVLRELQEVRDIPHLKNPMPDIYLQPPSRVVIGDGVKLFYFTKHHPANNIGGLVNQQLGFKVVPNPSTNQLIIYCPNDEAADTVVEYLEAIDLPPVQVNVDCLILERFGDVTTDWETTLLVENLFGEGVTLGEKRNTSAGLQPAFPGAQLREEARSTFGLDFGYWVNEGADGHQIRAMVDILESRGYLKILLNPTIETVNGKKASVTIQDYAPIEEIQTGRGGTSDVYSVTKYTWVADSLTIIPFVFSDGSIGLNTEIKVGSRSKPEGVTQKAIITERSIKVAENRIRPGGSLVIGGMRKSEKRSVVRGIPFLKDLPIIGILFSSKDFEEKGTEIIFILTPSISSGGREYKNVAEQIRRKNTGPAYEAGFTDMFTDPLGTGGYTDWIEKKAAQAEVDRVRAELDKSEAERIAEIEKLKADTAMAEMEKIQSDIQKLNADADKARAEVEKANIDTQNAQSLGQAEQKKALEALAEKEKAAAQAEQARKTAEEAKKQVQLSIERARQEEAKARQAVEQIEKAKAEIEKAAAEAVKSAATKAQADADAVKANDEKAQAQTETVNAAAAKAQAEAAAAKAKLEAEKAEQQKQSEPPPPIPQNPQS